MTDFPRLIEFAFPLKQASLDSVHEKNVRHGHISTLHIWPARRPLAACRAALIATLLPDPSAEPKPEGMSDAEWQEEIRRRRQQLCEMIGGRVVKRVERKKMPGGRVVERVKEETEGGILHWGRETQNADVLEWFRQQIRKAYGGRPPKVLDPFAGGGSIPLEAMRLGCEATAIDINPVAWFILKCTLEYPQKLAGKTRPLPDFILSDQDFMMEFLVKGKGYSKAQARKLLEKFGHHREANEQGFLFEPESDDDIQADLAWHVRAWGRWVLDRARRELARFYPVYADFEPLDKDNAKPYEPRPMRLVPLRDDGTPDIDALNAEFSPEYLADKRNPRWVAKPAVAYLWARTVTCKNCRATVPLFKTRWLCKKANKRVLLTMKVVGSPDHAPDPNCVANPSVANPSRDREGAAREAATGTALAYFITFTCYGTWLHGDQRGSVDRDHNIVGTPFLSPDQRREREQFARLKHKPINLNSAQRAVVERTISEVCEHRGWLLHALNVRTNHVHVVVSASTTPERVMNDFKSYATRRMVEAGLFPAKTKAWTRHGSTRYLWDEAALERACTYVLEGQGLLSEGQAQARGPLPDGQARGPLPDGQTRGPLPDGQTRGPLPDGRGSGGVARVVFGIETDVPVKGGNAAQRREHDKRIGTGTMSRAGARCPCCGTIMKMEDLRAEGKAGRLGTMPTAVVVDGPKGKEYRLPTEHEVQMAAEAAEHIERVFAEIPFGVPDEPMPSENALGMRVPKYGFKRWRDLFTPRQLTALGRFVAATRAARDTMRITNYPAEWIEAVGAYLACGLDRLVDFANVNTQWKLDADTLNHAMVRYAIQITWDFAEGNPIGTIASYSNGTTENQTGVSANGNRSVRPDLDRPTVLRCNPIFRLDGLVLRFRSANGRRPYVRLSSGDEHGARTEVG